MVQIITDSAADFEAYELQEKNITCIPLAVLVDGKEYQDGVDISKAEFYNLLQGAEPPKTAQASPAILTELFEKAHAEGHDALYITISGAISGTYQTAEMIRRELDSPHCFVVDGCNATGGQRQVVEYAVRLRDQGLSGAQIVEKLLEMKEKVRLYACMDTLEYLYLGGRISRAVYKLGSLANIKPIITIESDGRVTVPAKALGQRKGMDQLCKFLASIPMDPEFPLYVMFTSDPEPAQVLRKKLEGLGYPIAGTAQVGAAIGAHIGPNACGLVYVRK